MPTMTYQTPNLQKWAADRRPRFDDARRRDLANGLAFQLGCLQGWAEQAEAELIRLRDELARVRAQRDESDRELAMAETAVADARAESRRFTDEDAETTRPRRSDVFADAWDMADGVSAAFDPELGFGGNVHE